MPGSIILSVLPLFPWRGTPEAINAEYSSYPDGSGYRIMKNTFAQRAGAGNSAACHAETYPAPVGPSQSDFGGVGLLQRRQRMA